MITVEEIEHAAEQLPLKDLADLEARIARRRWELELAESAKVGPSDDASGPARMVVRDHSSFLNGYAPEDEGLYDDAAPR